MNNYGVITVFDLLTSHNQLQNTHKMKSIKNILIAITILLSSVVLNAQIKNAKKETVKIFGNCEMCKMNIEKAGNLNKVASVNWDKDTKMAVLTYDSSKTNSDEILKRIALAGYDNEKFIAPDQKYNTLHTCCQYDRDAKEEVKMDKMDSHEGVSNVSVTLQQSGSPLKPVFDNYFSLKDALVKTDATNASMRANEMVASLEAVQMDKLEMNEHMVWMKVMKSLIADTKSIAATNDVEKQRELFKTVSKNIYDLMKVSKLDTPAYYQYCPMVKANWLSKEEAVKNPYYGSKMLTCGSTVETIK